MSYGAARSLFLFDFFLLEVKRESDVRHSVVRQSSSTGQVSDVFHVCRSHNAFVKDGDIHKKLVERHILLRECPDEIVKLKPGDCKYRLVVKFGVVETIQKMNSAWP